MSSQLPVPSRAALTALRGVLLGTSCGIALIAEDRRRRINRALSVIENGERIKSARSYRPGGELHIAQRERDAFSDNMPLAEYLQEGDQHTNHPKRAKRPLSAPLRDEASESTALLLAGDDSLDNVSDRAISRDGLLSNEGFKAMLQQDASQTPSRTTRRKDELHKHANVDLSPARPPGPIIPPLPGPTMTQLGAGMWPSTKAEANKPRGATKEENEMIMARLRDACRDGDIKAIARAAQSSHGVFQNTKEWIETYALLCRTYMDMGRIGDALKVFHFFNGYHIVRGGEELVLANTFNEQIAMFEPLTLAELSLAEASSHPHRSPKQRTYLKGALECYLAIPREMQRDPRLFDVGRTLLFAMMEVEMFRKLRVVFRRATEYVTDDPDGFMARFLEKLLEKHRHRLAITIFLDFYPRLSPAFTSIQPIGDTLVQCVEEAHNWRAAAVLKTLYLLLPPVYKLKTGWVAKLFLADWARHRDFKVIEDIFESLMTTHLEDRSMGNERKSLDEVVLHPDCIYRIMVEIALEAGESAKAEKYLDAGAAYKPEIATDVQLLGIFALDCAKRGDWDEVRRMFETMKVDDEHSKEAHGRVFVPVAKIYARGHSIQETELFVHSYLNELKVPMSSFLVTLMAKQYALVRDFTSVAEWLEYCSRDGFPVDAAFANAILVTCKRQGNVSFRDLRTLFRKLRSLGPKLVDSHTERIIAGAALADPQPRGRLAAGRLSSLRISPNFRPIKNLCARDHDVILAMQESLATRRPGRAIRAYKQAMRLGMPASNQALHLAIQAAWDMPAPGRDARIMDLLQYAQRYGQDINYVTNYIISMRLKEMEREGPNHEKYERTKSVLDLFERKGISLTDVSFNRAAHLCLKAGHLMGAISFAHKAAEVRPGAEPCYNMHNFRILLTAYVEMVDVDRIREVIARVVVSDYAEQTGCLKTMKSASKRVLEVELPRVSDAQRGMARDIIKAGVWKIIMAREKLRASVQDMQDKALDIVRRAAVDAGCPPVDFDTIPWLGGGKGKGPGSEPELANHDDFVHYMEKLDGGGPGHMAVTAEA
ncbi:ribonuclease T2 [Podospora conica]|nr:ribonuclease T2 [Schizothecium conicum]